MKQRNKKSMVRKRNYSYNCLIFLHIPIINIYSECSPQLSPPLIYSSENFLDLFKSLTMHFLCVLDLISIQPLSLYSLFPTRGLGNSTPAYRLLCIQETIFVDFREKSKILIILLGDKHRRDKVTNVGGG